MWPTVSAVTAVAMRLRAGLAAGEGRHGVAFTGVIATSSIRKTAAGTL